MYPKEYIQYLVHFHGDRDYFECHEILEEYWKKSGQCDKQSIWVGFIQLAVSNYHHRRGNFQGAQKTIKKALEIFLTKEETINKLGLESKALLLLLSNCMSNIEQTLTYKSYNLPIIDQTLLSHCKDICKQTGINWGSNSDLTNFPIVHRHKLRDRTEVIQKRNNTLLKKGSK